MPHLLALLAQVSSPPNGGGSGNIFGIGYLVAAVLGPAAVIAVALIQRRRNAPDELADDRKRHVLYLQKRVEDLEREIDECRAKAETERKRLTAENKLQLLHIGELDARLVRAKADLAEARAELDTARAEARKHHD